jgi:hypothetical protein
VTDRPRAYYHDTRIELALEALKRLAHIIRTEGRRRRERDEEAALVYRERNEWRALYERAIAAANEMSEQLDKLREEGGTTQEVADLKQALAQANLELEGLKASVLR